MDQKNTQLNSQLEFIKKIDGLKEILRQTQIMSGGRRENSAEHSWHLAIMASVLAAYSREPIDVSKVVMMALVHDIVEIDAGDTFVYDDKARLEKQQKELEAAESIFGLLPLEQAKYYKALWLEYEEGVTPEAQFLAAIDRLQPLMCNYFTGGYSWRNHKVPKVKIEKRNAQWADYAPQLSVYAQSILDEAEGRGDFNFTK